MNGKKLINSVAESLYNALRKTEIVSPFLKNTKSYRNCSESKRRFYFEFASGIEARYNRINIKLQTFEEYCKTPLITDDEISRLTEDYLNNLILPKLSQKKILVWKSFVTELNYLIPRILKEKGYEIIRKEEINEISNKTVLKLARVIHSAYLMEVREKGNLKIKGTSPKYPLSFEDLPSDIKQSNIDNAYNIPAKLLSIGYKIRPLKKGFKSLTLKLTSEEIEVMAKVEHLRWSWEKRLNGWVYGASRDDEKKIHPGLIPYETLSEEEKDKDRELVKLIPAFLQDINYEAFPVSLNRIATLSYAIKPQGIIHRLLSETRDLNGQIRSLVTLTPEIEKMVEIRNRKIEEAIHEIEGSYKYAQHIQQTYLPHEFSVRELFPHSFVLFKPKDIVSGDFYFLSRNGDLLIFAVADCTGHGIPGALLSTLGYGILDQAVNELKLEEPSQILHHLYLKIHRFLRNFSGGEGIPDDMDIILCALDLGTNILKYSSVKNSLYRMSEGNLLEHPAQNSSSCVENDCKFVSTKIRLKHSDTLYLCSDGYSDQFGGKVHKRYQTTRLKKFISEIQIFSMTEQNDHLYQEIEKWREENNEDQTDDILILGVRI